MKINEILQENAVGTLQPDVQCDHVGQLLKNRLTYPISYVIMLL